VVLYEELRETTEDYGHAPSFKHCATGQGTTINFEPIASIDGQGFFLEGMYLITATGAELLTPGVPYSAEAIEAVMKK